MHKEKLCIVVFRNNLRICDNEALIKATNSCENMIALYSTEILEGTNLGGFKRCGDFRREFIYESLINLKKNLLRKNIWLYIVKDLKEVLEKLNQRFELRIFFEEEVGVLELEFEKILKTYKHKSFFNQTMLESFLFDYKKSFSHFRKKAEKLEVAKPLGDIEPKDKIFMCVDIKEIDIKLHKKNNTINGGEDEALNRVDFYLENFIHKYLDTRSLIDGNNISTMFSPYLAIGCISARQVYWKLKLYEEKYGSSKSSYWIYFELLWRDFFYFVMLQSKNRLFLKNGLLETSYDFKSDKKLLDDFFMAKTGVDIIDAGIVELKNTGWLSNRQRQLVASFFIKNLGLDFRYCAAFYEEYLLDYNPASNYGNFAYQAGVGNDKEYRVFDPIKQSKFYGGKKYVQKWLNKEEISPNFDYRKLALDVKKSIYNIKD